MAALLVGMSIMAVMMTVAMPVWKHNIQREKEEELVFRGKQYVKAIELFGRKYANAQPPNVDVLIEQHFLRKKYKDPVTNDDFDLLRANQAQPGSGQSGAPGSGPTGAPGRGGPTGSPAPSAGATSPMGATAPASAQRGASPIGSPGANPVGGIIGVASKSKDKSIRLYNGRSHYNEWAFVYQPQQQTPGGGPGAGAPGGIPGQRGGPPGRGGQGPFDGQRGGRGDGRGPGFGPSGPGFGPGGQRFPNGPGPAFPITPGNPGPPNPGAPPSGRGRQ